ncbi:MAG: beta-ketoacyl-[acyl-carrier-protein] synthase family protein [Alphaproteobacteria bacterium]|nr:beta-ketoacyl-[acyl-carrier-protein] synthase family protein [Alphaproteobacteria bacterium]
MTRFPYVTAYTCVNAAGIGVDGLLQALRENRGGLLRPDGNLSDLDTYVGQVDGVDSVSLPSNLAQFDCRNNRLAELALGHSDFADQVVQARQRYGAGRIGVLLGTSTSGIASAELAYQNQRDDGSLPDNFNFRTTHELASLSDYVRLRFSLKGPHFTISTACSSSAKTFVDAAQLIAAGLCDAVVVGGVDSLCETSLRGFNALQLLSPEPCRPNDKARKGICIGEAACFVLLEREGPSDGRQIVLRGYGESSDAHHMSSPHPQGLGARLAMQQALDSAGLAPDQISYINMHGTGSAQNDRVEDAAIAAVLGSEIPCSSTKGWTGHTLGAAGGMEAVIALICLEAGLVPGNLNMKEPDDLSRCNLVEQTFDRPLIHVMTNNFGFGGNNCSLIFSRQDVMA